MDGCNLNGVESISILDEPSSSKLNVPGGVYEQSFNMPHDTQTVADPGVGPWGPKGRKIIFETGPVPPLSQGLDDRPPAPLIWRSGPTTDKWTMNEDQSFASFKIQAKDGSTIRCFWCMYINSV